MVFPQSVCSTGGIVRKWDTCKRKLMRGTCLHSARRLTCACGRYPHGRSRKRSHATPCGPGHLATRERPGSPWGALFLVGVRRTIPINWRSSWHARSPGAVVSQRTWPGGRTRTHPAFSFVPKDNLNVTPVGLARDPPTHDFRGHRPENAGAQRRRRYLATSSRRWDCVSNRSSRTSSVDHGDRRSGGARMAAARPKYHPVGRIMLSLP